MIWIIIFALCVAMFVVGVQTYDDEFLILAGVVGVTVGMAIIAIQFCSAVMVDLELIEEKTEIQMMRAGIAEIKASIYDSKRGHMFDAQNMSQS